MRLLIRRYVTAEQRKRDEFGITEDDVMEIRQDISTLRYELIDILKQNGMRTPDVDKAEASLSGKKGRVMERRLQKDFQIGLVEGIVNSVIQSEKEPKDVFSQIARAIGRKSSSGSKKKDWNAAVRHSTLTRDPIGSKTEAMIKQTRRSLRRHLHYHPDSDLASMDPDRLVAYNPNLSAVSPTTRIAYAKFILSRIPKTEGGSMDGGEPPEEQEEDTVKATKRKVVLTQKSSRVSLIDAVKQTTPTGSMKKSLSKTESALSLTKADEKDTLEIKDGEVRAPSPIPEDPREEDIGKASSSKQDSVKEQMTQDEKKENEGMGGDEDKNKEGGKDEKKKDEGGDDNEEGKGKVEGDDRKKEKREEKKQEKPSTSAPPPQEDPALSTTKPRGKSKATGQVMGGWL